VDWEQVELDYRTNVKTLVAIGDEHGISEALVRKMAKKKGWERDLGERVRVAAKARLLRSAAPDVPGKPRRSEAEVIAEAAAAQADIIVGHRTRLIRLRDVADKAVAHLDAIADDPSKIGFVLDALSSLTSTTATLIKLERQTFNIDGEQNTGDGAKVYRIERVIIDVSNPHGASLPSAA
jgi:hypothetical protein